MANERLRVALARAGLTIEAAARVAGVDPKTVQRWLAGRIPHARHRWAIAAEVGEEEEFLWPEARRPGPSGDDVTAEVLAAYAHRSELDTRRWWDLFLRAEREIDLLGYTLYFLPQQHPGLADLLGEKAKNGCRIRIGLADPTSAHVRARDEEEHQAITLIARIQSTLDWLDPVLQLDDIDVRLQDAPLYNSIFRFDDQMLVTPHLFATPGHSAPMLHLKRLGPNGLFSRFAAHFEGVWANSRPMREDRTRTTVPSGG
jgi:transcriptional regulator with XRE-family HTH domain